jgi:hypothetical protein
MPAMLPEAARTVERQSSATVAISSRVSATFPPQEWLGLSASALVLT